MLLFAFSFFNAEEVFLAKTGDNKTTDDNKVFDFITNEISFKQIDNHCQNQLSESMAKPLFNKMVLIVIDALRHDFIPSIDRKAVRNGRHTNSGDQRMPFTEQLMKTNGIFN